MEAEPGRLRGVAGGREGGGGARARKVGQGADWLVVGLAAVEGADSVAWTLKRLQAARDPVGERRRWWLAVPSIGAIQAGPPPPPRPASGGPSGVWRQPVRSDAAFSNRLVRRCAALAALDLAG